MRIKFTIFCVLSILWHSTFAQQEVELGSITNFTSTYLNAAKKMKQMAGESSIDQIQFSDTLLVSYKINKVEEAESIIRVYGVLQFPHVGGVFIVKNGNEIEGDIFFSNWNKVLRFETRGDRVYLKEDKITSIICVEKEKPLIEQNIQNKTGATTDQALAVDTRKLQSYPGAKAVVYIDFDGHMSGQRWANSYTSGVQFYLTPANISSDNEYTIWKIMSEDFKPFDINITTDSTIFHQYATNRRQRLVVTRNSSWQTVSSTGIAYVNGFSSGDDPCFAFPSGFSSSNPMPAASAERLGEVSSHEVGHTVGLSHDGSSSTSYYSGHGNWAPIMGSGYYRNVTQWSKGEYANANQLQDDLAIITKAANGFGYKADDCGNTYSTSKSLVITSGGIVNAADNTGVIEQSTDIDAFKFTTTGGTVTLHFGTATPKPNLDIKASLYNSSNILITSNDAANYTYADISTSLVAGTYYITVEGVGYGDPLSTGYSKYASLGYYEISGTIPTSGAGNIAPTVSITSPSNGATFTAPASVTINATAADADGSISKVEFYNGVTLLSSDNTSPYSYVWTGVTTGIYSLTAKAYDNSGAVTTSSSVSVTVTSVSNQLPTISITSPVNNATFTAPASITINANAADADGSVSKVEFYRGTTLLTTDNTSPYSYTWTNVVAGTYSLTAKAYDNSAGVTTSSVITITVNSTTGCTAPAWNSSTIYLGDNGLGVGNGEIVSYNGRQYRAKWWTQNNTPGTSDVWLDLGACIVSNQNPTVSITAPSNNASYIAPATVNIAVMAADSDGSISKVEFYNGTTKLGEDASSPYTYAWTNVIAGTYSLTARAYDNSTGVTTSSVVTIVVSNPNQNPTVSITAPSNNATFTAPATVSITATAADSDGSISKVEFYNGTTKLGEDASSPYTYAWTNVIAGTYSLTARAYDNSTGVTTSSVATIVVSNPNQNPTVSITAPANNATFTAPATVNITATAADADGNVSKVEFYTGTTKLGEDASSPYTYEWTNVAAGTYSLTAKAYDNSIGTASSAVVTIIVSNPNQNPTVSITTPSNNASYIAPATVNIMATAADADGTISRVEFYNGPALLSTDYASPYSYDWTNVGAGTYSLTAKAYDNNGAVTTSAVVSITVSPAQTGTENCSNILPWNSNAIYVANDLVTFNGFKYKAKWWTKNNNPATNSGQYDVWENLGECIPGTLSSAGPQLSAMPAGDVSLFVSELLEMDMVGLSSGTITQVSYVLYNGTTVVNSFNKNAPDFSAFWNAAEVGDYLLQIVVKDEKGMLIYSDARSVKVSEITGIHSANYGTIQVVPNPNNARFHLLSSMDLKGSIIEMTDMTGHKVYESVIQFENEEVAPEQLQPGMYLLKVLKGEQILMAKIQVY